MSGWLKETLGWTVEVVKRPRAGSRGAWVPPGIEAPVVKFYQ